MNYASPAMMGFYINDIPMPIPANFTWKPPAQVGINGAGKQRIYPFWGIDLSWDYITIDEYNLLYTTYLGVQSGSINVTIPIIYMGPGSTLQGYGFRELRYFNVMLDAPTLTNVVDGIAAQAVKMSVRRIALIPAPIQPNAPPVTPPP